MCAKLALLWHMHQPCYKEPQTGSYAMPWVFLHATKDYREMLDLALERGANVTFNFVPILLDQLDDYSTSDVRDAFLDLLRKDPDHLVKEERVRLAAQLAMLHLENQAKRFGRLNDLVGRMQRRHRVGEEGAAPAFGRAEWLDLEVLYLLAWTGEETRARSEFIVNLAHRGEGFSQEEKLKLLDELHAVCADTQKAFKEAWQNKNIELSASPYCHPILPLLIDLNSAKVAVPEIRVPHIEAGTFGDDAARQVSEAVVRHSEAFGGPPGGFWPSEGSVSPQALALLAANGARWAATDEDILAATLGRSLSGAARRELYRPYAYKTPSGEIKLFFRDKALSDLIGFVYASWPARAAALDFANRLTAIARAHGDDSVITVVLDGENAWEHYAENGAPFLRELYSAVNASGSVKFATFSELCDGAAPTLSTIHSGSWIYGSFTTWIGHQEKNRAWELLAAARAKVAERIGGLDGETAGEVWRNLRIAEGSDWFWWLGDDHYTPLAGRFDELFRSRLMAVYRLLGEEEPSSLRLPIKRIGRRGLVGAPRDSIRPTVDGRSGSFFKWFDAGRFDLGFDAGSMHRTDSVFDLLLFGSDRENLYLCLGKRELAEKLKSGFTLEVVEGPEEKSVLVLGGDLGLGPGGAYGAFGGTVEISIPLIMLSRDGENRVTIAFRLLREGKVEERAPLIHMAEFVPEADRSFGGWSA